jgi:hypothetical protein
LPGDEQIGRRLDRIGARVVAAQTKAMLSRTTMPKAPKRIVSKILEASALDLGAVEPDGWIEHLSAAVPQRVLVRIAKQPSTRWLRIGLPVLIRRASPKRWDDLEREPFAGQRSVMTFIREFPGLELLRLPDQAYEASALTALEEVPF